MRPILPALVLLLLFGLTGCSEQSTTKQSTNKEKAESTKHSDVKLEVVDFDELTAAIKKHKGKVVVVDVWGTFCVPCKKEFPHLIELHRKYASQGVACISVSVDDPKDKDNALQFLTKQQASIENHLVDYVPLQDAWVFSGVPVVRVYSPSGEVAKQFTNADPDKEPFTYADVEKLVQELLKK